ncbi:phosphate ABC transporter permease subunit PstC [Dietzia cinnamea]|uniref:phosphate ABC transporter permease subunit PstC n=1 Tax=Dietzia cinnamea TaxID=321318 RepID=UPI000AB7EB4B|nr:phosphate ABC transporter permease subunit PstC [Dietzia cinnamea]MCT2062423.1 phosphate ABC transporter permease subunit PstC [Dietzia cinnamea]MCT2237460.1 phosphate ABC transporter permease subunit PstC [Dietzia cinnamea]MCT2299726.1 phosphate ABC transporter permease subunit PstC [Dietzia cinnamea]
MTVHESVDRDAGKNSSSGGPADGTAPASDADTGGGSGLRDAGSSQRIDAIFRGLTVFAGAVIVALIALIGIVLVLQAVPSILEDQVNFFTSSEWNTTDPDNLRFGILDLLKVTVLSSVFALVLAVPVAIGIATFLVQYAPPRISRALSAMIDLLAAVPSIVYGMWGLIVLGPWITPFATWLNENLGWFFLFADGNVSIAGGGTIFTAGIVLAIMILPIITSMSRETIRQTPSLHQEAALALGATRWEKIRMTCFPYAKSGMIAGSMLALGRALGETVAVLIILRAASSPSTLSLFDGGFTFASKIASGSAEFNNPMSTGAYIAAGLVLFLLTFIVNLIARSVSGGKVNG